jgi:acyl-CoA synthetase (AMP-forming)/AMP-acid ligase II
MTLSRGLHPAQKVRDYQARGWWSEETIDQLYLAQVAARRGAVAVVDPANRETLLGSAPRRLTWGELDDEVTALAAHFDDLGLRRGDVLGMQLPNSIELVEVYLAAWLLGIVVSPMPMQYREHEVMSIARRAEFVAFIGTASFGSRSSLTDVAANAEHLPGLRHVIAVDTAAGRQALAPGVTPWVPRAAGPSERERVAARRASDPNHPNDLTTICWTSGTESDPKGVLRTHLDWIAASWSTVEGPMLTCDDVELNPFPMVNMGGINSMLVPWLRTGCVLVQHHPFDLPTFLDQIAAEQITYTCAAPTVLMSLLQDAELLDRADLSTLTRISSGSAPLQPAMVRGWQERGIGIINFFGSNEGAIMLSSVEDFPDPDDRARYFPRYGVPGFIWPSRLGESMHVRVVDTETGIDLTEPGTPGELRVIGPTLFPGYLGGGGEAFDEQGYLRTGDLFEIAGDQGQLLLYVGRAKDLVIRGGMNISPAELEGLIDDHPAVVDVAIIGDPDEHLGETVAAVVVLTPGASLGLAELNDFLREKRIASFKLPARLEIRDEMPRNPTGKILKRHLRRHASTPTRD